MKGLRYVRCTANPDDERDLIVGEFYALCWDAEHKRWECELTKHSTHFFDEDEIKIKFEPSTAEEFQASIARVMESLNGAAAEHERIVREISGVSDLALTSGDDPAELADAHDQREAAADLPEGGAGTALTLRRRQPAGQLRNKAHALKRKVTSLAETVKTKRELVEAKIAQQLAAFEGKIAEMNALVEKLTEVVTMVNLYLGRDEEITCLREGPKAPTGTPIAIRQAVLYMDEECAEAYPEGIDYTGIEKFDQWILQPKNLLQVIPNEKGIIVLQVRRTIKNYEGEGLVSVLANLEKNKENLKSYWLIKNGQNLHRLWTDIAVGVRLVPREDELDHFFVQRKTNWDTHESEEHVIRPGTKEYYEAMKSANGHRRHYMRLLLVLQGLFDRTRLLAPYAGNVKPNLLDENTWEGNVVFVRDTERVIEDGKPTFREWLGTTNKELRHGHRICGYFPRQFGYGNDADVRVSPKTAEAPPSEAIHTLIMEGGKLRFRYDRTEKIWKKSTWRSTSGMADPQRRASYSVDRGDSNFVCIDNANVEEMEYYTKDRRHRKHYEQMIPALRAAIKMKQEEAKQEQPFRDLLLRELARLYPHTPCSAVKLETLISWWKFKVREHRALLSDDRKAYQMIVAEYVRQVIPADKLAEQTAIILRDAVEDTTDTLAVWHKGGGEFVLLRAVEGYPIFVHVETWSVVGAGAVKSEEALWHIPHKVDYLRWDLVHESPAWTARPEQPNRTRYLSGPQIEQAVAWAQANPPKEEFRGETTVEKVLAVYMLNEPEYTEVRVVTLKGPEEDRWGTKEERAKKRAEALRRAEKPKTLEQVDTPDFKERLVRWKREQGELVFHYGYKGGTSTHISSGVFHKGWEKSERRLSERETRLLFLDATLHAEIEACLVKYAAHNRRSSNLRDWIRGAGRAAEEYLLAQWRATQLEKYTSEDGDPDYFDDHLKTLKKPEFELSNRRHWNSGGKPDRADLSSLLESCVNAVAGDLTELAGKTLAAALHHCGLKAKKPLDDVLTLIQSDWVLPAKIDNDD